MLSHSPSSARLLIFSGFLGSGKTTLIIELAKQLAAVGDSTCFVVNEAGEVGVDQQTMRDFSLDVREITAGCICCQLGASLVTTLHTITGELHPRVVIIEASGLAIPAGILDGLSHYQGAPFTELNVVTVVDPTRLQVLFDVVGPLVRAQIEQADEIVISKVDQASAGELTFAEEIIRELKPGAKPWRTAAVDDSSLRPLLARLTTGTAG